MKKKNLAFTLAEVLIVIGIIGVVAALTLPNLNHATGDKETVTRLQKAYSALSEANDRAVAIYGPIAGWSENCKRENYFVACWINRVGEFMKVSKVCITQPEDFEQSNSCDFVAGDYWDVDDYWAFMLSDGTVFAVYDAQYINCDYSDGDNITDLCFPLHVDVNGPKKGKNTFGTDQFTFALSNSRGVIPYTSEYANSYCIQNKNEYCTNWILEYGNLDYLKADEEGKCNDSNIILDGTTNTSCH